MAEEEQAAVAEVAAKRQQQQEQAAAARARSSKTKTAEEAVAAMAERMKRSVKVNATHAPGTVLANETTCMGVAKKKFPFHPRTIITKDPDQEGSDWYTGCEQEQWR